MHSPVKNPMLRKRGLWTQIVNRCRSVGHRLGKQYWAAQAIADVAVAPPANVEESPLYRHILEDQTELICRYRADTTIEYANPAYCRFFGIRAADIIGQSYQPIIYEGDRAAVAQQVAQMTCQNPLVVIENRVVAQGEVRWTRWTNRCLCDDTSTIIAYQSVGQDITQLKHTELQLRHSEQRYRTLMETIPQLIWVAEADGLYTTHVNQRWLDFTGKTLDAVVGQGWLSAVHPDDLAPMQANWMEAIASGSHYQAEMRLRRADGIYIWHLAKAEPTRDETGQVLQWFGTCTDISDRKQLELEHQRAEWALQALNKTLETRIAERTASLAAANEILKQEIVERSALTRELQASQERFRRAVIDAPFPIMIHAENGQILQMSQAVSDITGYSADELPTLAAWTAQAYGDRQQTVLTAMKRLYDLNRRVDEGEFEVNTRWQGKRIWLFSSAPLGRLPDGTRLVISMAADVTQQKQTEKTLAARLRQQAVVTQLSQTALSGLQLQTLFEQATNLIVEGLHVDYAKVLELQPDQRSLLLKAGTGWHPGLVGTAIVSNDVDSQAGYTLQSSRPVVVADLTTEIRFQGPSLLIEHQVVSGISVTISGSNGAAYGVLGAHSTQPRAFTQEDVNFLQAVSNLLATAIERQRTEAQLNELNQTLEDRIRDRTQALQEMNEELRAFSYSIAHDLRAPLRAIQGFAHVLCEDYGTTLDAMGQEYITRMATSAEYLDTLIQDMLVYSQLGRAEMSLSRVDTAALWREVLDDAATKFPGQTTHISANGNWPQVYAQRNILRQALSNLLSNAIKFVPPGVSPQIRLWAEVPSAPAADQPDHCPGRVRLWIQDNGIGIAPRHHQRIFKPFERLHGIESYPGTGIGLSIVKRAVERMNGSVGVESRERQGSRFWVELESAE